MELAKLALDVGLATNSLDDTLAFWQNTAKVPFDEMLPLGGGRRQHRHRIGESILKINHSREPVAATPPTGYRRLSIATANVDRVTELTDPDGNNLTLVPPGHDNIQQLEMLLVVRDLAAHREFYGAILELPEAEPDVFACGVSRIRLRAGEAGPDATMEGTGYRYVTMQVFDVKQSHGTVVSRGGVEGRAPVKLGDVAHISFVRDPDGNWIELSQRKSITGTLD